MRFLIVLIKQFVYDSGFGNAVVSWEKKKFYHLKLVVKMSCLFIWLFCFATQSMSVGLIRSNSCLVCLFWKQSHYVALPGPKFTECGLKARATMLSSNVSMYQYVVQIGESHEFSVGYYERGF